MSPVGNLARTDAQVGKAGPFAANDLAHFVDGQSDVLTSIRASCWAFSRSLPPSAQSVGGKNLKLRALLLNGRSRKV